jgi:hypothetical protein
MGTRGLPATDVAMYPANRNISGGMNTIHRPMPPGSAPLDWSPNRTSWTTKQATIAAA